MAKKRLKDKVSAQARRDARLKYEPQRRQLTDAQQQVADQFSQAARAETASSRGIAASIDEVKPKVAGYIGNAQGVSSQASQDLATYLNGNVLQGAAARDSAGTRRRLAETLANTTTELDQRKVDAAAGAKYTIGSLRASAGKQLEKIGGQLTDLASDEGTYASSQADRLRQAAANRATTRRGQDLSHQDRVASREAADRRASTRAAEKEAEKNGFKKAAPGTVKSTMSAIAYAKSIAADQKSKSGASRAQVAKWLVQGRPSQKVDVDGEKVSVPGINKTDELFASVGLDLAYDGHVSDRNRKLLNKLGISVKDLGLPSRGSTGGKRPSVSYGLRGAGDAIRGK